MRPPYLEDWIVWSYEGPSNNPHYVREERHGASICIPDPDATNDYDDVRHECLATMCADSEEHAKARAYLAAAAPALVRALLAVEWQRGIRGSPMLRCPGCWDIVHDTTCPVDAALSAAGL